jgi:UTP--glucose-1-phosphate uridylyltransferase
MGTGASKGLIQARDKMVAAGVDEVAIETFAHYYRLLEHGETGMIPESTIDPVGMESLDDVEVADDVAAEAIRHTVVIRLNGAAASRSSTSSPGRCSTSARSTTPSCR